MKENFSHPGPKPRLWDLRFIMLTATFALLWVYLVAQGATAFEIVSGGGYWLGLAPALAIEIGEIVALILWSSEAKSRVWSWQFGAVVIAAFLSAIVQYLAADSVAGEKISVELKIILSVGVAVLAVSLGKSAGERFSAWQAEFRRWKTAETEWNLAEEERREELEYERKQAEESRKYRRKRREEKERLKAESGRKEGAEPAPRKEEAHRSIEGLSDACMERLKTLDKYLIKGNISVSAEEAFYIMGIGKSQGYRILSAGVSTGVLEKFGRKWRRRDGMEREISNGIPTEGETP